MGGLNSPPVLGNTRRRFLSKAGKVAAHAEYDEKRRELEKQEIELRFLEKGDDFTVLREVVETEDEKRKKA